MVDVKEVTTKKMQKEFLNFPNILYKDNYYYVPPLMSEEKKIFDKNYYYYEGSEAVYFNAYRDDKIVGRISCIIQHQANKKNNEKRVRFTRFDVINDLEVAKALLDKAEEWSKSKGMDTICGPLGFSDLERLGMLVKGFREYATYEEAYNYSYYPELIEQLGYTKEVDWLEFKLFAPDKVDEKLVRLANRAKERYGLHEIKITNLNKFLDKYKEQIFEVLDQCYDKLYGTVPFTKGMINNMVAQFKLVLKPEYLIAVADKDDNVVAFGVGLPSLAEAVRKSKGKLTPASIVRLLKAIKHPIVADCAVVGIRPDMQGSGIAAILFERMIRFMVDNNFEHLETNFCLENNTKIQQIWQLFEREQHKIRRSYMKKLV